MRVGKCGLLVALVSGILALTGCGSSSADEAAAPSATPEAPSGFQPCTDVPQAVLDSEELRNRTPDDATAGGIVWDGCMWLQTDGYSVGIRTTNMTLEMVKGKNFPGTEGFEAGGRPAVVSQQGEAPLNASCNVNVQMVGGSLEFLLSNPPSRSKTGHLDTCELVRNLASKVAPNIPAAA